MRCTALVVAALVSLATVGADSSFWLRNTDPQALFLYWTVEGSTAVPAAQVLPGLPLAPGGRHPVAPGERVKVTVAAGRSFVGVFVPWSEAPTFLSPLTGGFLLPGEFPAKGTLQVDAGTFRAANRGRLLEAPLEAWGLELPGFVLDGRVGDWAKVPPLLEWGPGFQPGAQPWPGLWPRVRTLQVADREGALWVHLSADKGWSSVPPGTSVSLVVRRPGAFWEWPLTGSDGTVWDWSEKGDPAAVGFRRVEAGEMEAFVPWDRMPAPERRLWTSAKLVWSLLVTEGAQTRVLDLGPGSWEEFP